ncbi:hypothetical protein [Mesorhizobium sp.]|uniref:hypothetical protein n=1 Tax=Mesorhizobium sp. TaxID=1871066 RepID=UPI000FE883D8|nr:hypothetical protein [Mesorhizobium sp.]RWQ12786.1 MAG: hypothetical protein EOR93_32775 [Mesorhizobium sp.]
MTARLPIFTLAYGKRIFSRHFASKACLSNIRLNPRDFHIANRLGNEAWVEAVTANPQVPYNHVNAPFADVPTEREEIFFGTAALRSPKRSEISLNDDTISFLRSLENRSRWQSQIFMHPVQ